MLQFRTRVGCCLVVVPAALCLIGNGRAGAQPAPSSPSEPAKAAAFTTPPLGATESAQPPAVESAPCVPSCRDGFVCVKGSCVSACNPPCGANQTCTDTGECVGPTQVEREDNDRRTFGLSALGGYLLSGKVSVEGNEVDTTSGYVLRAALDGYLIPRLSMGATFIYGHTSLKDADVAMNLKALGGTIKGHFGDPLGLQVRAGLAVGYQMETVDIPDTDDVHGLGVAPVVEVAIPVSRQLNAIVHGSFLSQPSGGDGNIDVTWAPIVYFGAGIEFVK